jgi:hypothetical protein
VGENGWESLAMAHANPDVKIDALWQGAPVTMHVTPFRVRELLCNWESEHWSAQNT